MPLIRINSGTAEALREEEYASEAELEDLLSEHVELLREGDDPPLALVTRQLHLPDSGIADLVFVDASGVPVVVEVKLARNPQSRREVIAQVFDYASALTDWTVDELDDATGGALETALRKLLEEDEVAFKAGWRAVGANLRAGMVRVVAVVDRQTEDLSRVISFINDHSDLDVRLVVVEKYREPGGDVVLSSTTTILGDEQASISRGGSSARKLPPSDAFQAVLTAYEAIDDAPLQLVGKARTYRALKVPGWPKSLHYEFVDVRQQVDADIHMESDVAVAARAIIQELVERLASDFPNAECAFDPRWSKGRGRLRVIHDEGTPPETIAQNMVRLIEATREPIAEVLAGRKGADGWDGSSDQPQ